MEIIIYASPDVAFFFFIGSFNGKYRIMLLRSTRILGKVIYVM